SCGSNGAGMVLAAARICIAPAGCGGPDGALFSGAPGRLDPWRGAYQELAVAAQALTPARVRWQSRAAAARLYKTLLCRDVRATPLSHTLRGDTPPRPNKGEPNEQKAPDAGPSRDHATASTQAVASGANPRRGVHGRACDRRHEPTLRLGTFRGPAV